jgi:hypothetical protein
VPLAASRLALEISQDRQYPPVVGRIGGQPELAEDVRNVTLDRGGRHYQVVGYASVGPSLCHQRENLSLPPG